MLISKLLQGGHTVGELRGMLKTTKNGTPGLALRRRARGDGRAVSDAPAQEPAAAADAPAGVTLATMRLYCVLQAERIAIVQDHLVKSGLRGAWAPSAAMDVDI
ncbi:MAG: hypothetical protein M5U08_13800, partial [Burkholderiales bacterium]|nr:hypothetical protein [Burkholderiales bacterium]